MINDKPVLSVASCNVVYLPRFIHILHFTHLKALQILPPNNHNESNRNNGTITETVIRM